jgi:ketosteroid isomerase-like protein
LVQENPEIVRKPLVLRERSGRTLDQRVALRFPRLSSACFGLVLRLRPGSRLRQAVLGRAVSGGLEAFNRRDWDTALAGLHPDCEVRPPLQLVDAGLMESCYVGPTGYRRFVSGWSEVFGRDLRIDKVELIDLGDTLLVLAEVPGRGRASGAPFTQKWAFVSTLHGGKEIRHEQYLDHAEALNAVGLRA